MLLSYNSKEVIKFVTGFDKLKNIDKLRFAIHTLENLYRNHDKIEIINLLKRILKELTEEKDDTIICFSQYKHLTIIAAKFMEQNSKDQLKIIIEMLFNIYETDWSNPSINEELNQKLLVLDLLYEVVN